jgi:predicted ester cyclase
VTSVASQLVENYGRVWDVGAPEGLVDQIFTPDVVDHNPQPGQSEGREGIRQVIDLYHAAFPDLCVTNDDVIVSGDRAVLRWSATGTHEGNQLGVPPTHRQVRMTGIDILRLEGERIAERWGEANALEMMRQIGSA